MQALVSKIEAREGGFRVAQVVAEDATFDVTNDFIWIACDETVIADKFWYDITNDTFNLIPVIEPVPFELPG